MLAVTAVAMPLRLTPRSQDTDRVLSRKMMGFDGLRRIELVEINPAARHLLGCTRPYKKRGAGWWESPRFSGGFLG
jgi:hypothetical protein